MIEPPSGGGGVQFGLGQGSAIEFSIDVKDPDEGPHSDRNAGLGQSGFDNQTLFENIVTGAMIPWPNYWALSQGKRIVGDAFTHYLAINGNPACASDGHTVQPQSDSVVYETSQ